MLRCRAHLCCCVRAAASVEASFDRLAQRRHLRAGASDWPAPKEDAGPSVSMRTVELCGRPSPHPLPGLRSASGSPRACLWFTRRPQPAASGTVECSVVPRNEVSSISCAKIACTTRYCFAVWRMAHAGAGVASGSGSSHVHGNRPLFSPHGHAHVTQALQSSRHIRTRYLRWLRSKVQVSTFYSSTRVSQRPPVAVHVHVIAELLARACHVTCARTPSHTAIPSTAPRRPCLSYIPRLRSLWL